MGDLRKSSWILQKTNFFLGLKRTLDKESLNPTEKPSFSMRPHLYTHIYFSEVVFQVVLFLNISQAIIRCFDSNIEMFHLENYLDLAIILNDN